MDDTAATASSEEAEPAYVGFWMRVVAALIDSVLVTALIYPLLIALAGSSEAGVGRSGALGMAIDLLRITSESGALGAVIQIGLPAAAVIVFWLYRSATPGKMVIGAVIVDARTLGMPSTRQLVGRYLGYYVSTIPLGMGLLWIAFDPRKQGWHDKLAGTLVIRRPRTKIGV